MTRTHQSKYLLSYFQVCCGKIEIIMRNLGLNLIRQLVMLDGSSVISSFKRDISLYWTDKCGIRLKANKRVGPVPSRVPRVCTSTPSIHPLSYLTLEDSVHNLLNQGSRNRVQLPKCLLLLVFPSRKRHFLVVDELIDVTSRSCRVKRTSTIPFSPFSST
jgi:hypothetical protein